MSRKRSVHPWLTSQCLSASASALFRLEWLMKMRATSTLVRSTIELAHALGLRVVAEGVEDEASLRLLVDLGCDLAQGYLISRPKPPDEVTLQARTPFGQAPSPVE
jgi:EAL domain-containing protein (putative c-di-GMP-specific phosphodiesterase class I)